MISEALKCNSKLTTLMLGGDEKEGYGRNNKEIKKRENDSEINTMKIIGNDIGDEGRKAVRSAWGSRKGCYLSV